MGGGGANSLDSPKTADNGDFESDNYDTGLSVDNNKTQDTISEYTYKSYDDYFTDLNIAAETILEQDLTGSGSASAPYIVHSTRGFLWLTTLNINSKYIELACDIVLNDEMFDENGNPSGGDGVVYQWNPDIGAYNTHINGNGFGIYGLYFNNAERYDVRFFAGVLDVIENVDFYNAFVQGKGNVFLVGHYVNTIRNVNTYSGTIKGEGSVCAFVRNANLIENCNNFIDVYATANYCGAFVIRTDNLNKHTIIKNCNNYGDLYGVGIMGAFVCFSYQSDCDFYNCKNFGSLTSTGDYSIGGIIGIVSGTTNIINCESYGKINAVNSWSSSLFVGQFINNYETNEAYTTNLIIKNSKAEIDYNFSNGSLLCGNTQKKSGRKSNMIIDGVCLSINNLANNKTLISGLKNCYSSCILRNIKIDIFGATNTGYFNIASEEQSNLSTKSFLVTGDLSNRIKLFQSGITLSATKAEIDGVLVNTNNYLEMVGTDFSGFYTDWKSGEIGLKALSGKGFFQTTLTEEMLLAKGFTQKTA